MDQVAIMKKSWGLIPKILSGEKIIESRWYMNKVAPWGKINSGDAVYFKNSGEPVNVKAMVSRVLQFDNLNQEKVKSILGEYGNGLGIDNFYQYFNLFKNKRYCILVFLDKPERIEPFEIDKTGYGAMAAWMCIEDINKIKIIF